MSNLQIVPAGTKFRFIEQADDGKSANLVTFDTLAEARRHFLARVETRTPTEEMEYLQEKVACSSLTRI